MVMSADVRRQVLAKVLARGFQFKWMDDLIPRVPVSRQRKILIT